jgi:hypothetical protein
MDDLARVAGGLELAVELSLAADAGSLLLPTTLPSCNVLPVLIFILILLAAGSPRLEFIVIGSVAPEELDRLFRTLGPGLVRGGVTLEVVALLGRCSVIVLAG